MQTSAKETAKKKRKRGTVPFNDRTKLWTDERNLLLDPQGFQTITKKMLEPPEGFTQTFECDQKPQIRLMGDAKWVADTSEKIISLLKMGKPTNLTQAEFSIFKNQQSHYESEPGPGKLRDGSYCLNILRGYINPEGR